MRSVLLFHSFYKISTKLLLGFTSTARFTLLRLKCPYGCLNNNPSIIIITNTNNSINSSSSPAAVALHFRHAAGPSKIIIIKIISSSSLWLSLSAPNSHKSTPLLQCRGNFSSVLPPSFRFFPRLFISFWFPVPAI